MVVVDAPRFRRYSVPFGQGAAKVKPGTGNLRSYWVKEDGISLTALLAQFVSSRVRGRVRTGASG